MNEQRIAALDANADHEVGSLTTDWPTRTTNREISPRTHALFHNLPHTQKERIAMKYARSRPSAATRRTPSKIAAIAAGAAVITLLGACSSTGGKPQESGNGMGAGTANTPRATVAMITHEVPGDSFWDLIRKGAQAAADKDNIELRYSNDPEAPNQANLVQSAIDSKVNGIAVTLAKPDAMAPAVKAALDAGIPVVAFNSGFDNFKAMGVQEYFGQDEKLAGVAAGERRNTDGAKKVICVIQEQGQVALESRCAGVAQGFKGQSEILNVNSKD